MSHLAYDTINVNSNHNFINRSTDVLDTYFTTFESMNATLDQTNLVILNVKNKTFCPEESQTKYVKC